MIEFIKDLSKTLKQPPGTVVPVGNHHGGPVKIAVFDYDAAHLEERTATTMEACYELRDKPGVSWINVDGVHDPELIEKFDSHFGIHSLIGEDIVNTDQRPKLEDHGGVPFYCC